MLTALRAQLISDGTISGGAGQDTFLVSTLATHIQGGADVDPLPSLVHCKVQLLTSVPATVSSPFLLVLPVLRSPGYNDTFIVTVSNLQTSSSIAGGDGTIQFLRG